MMQEVDLERIIKAAQRADDVLQAYAIYRELGGKLGLGEFANVLVYYGIAIRRGCP